MGAHLNFAMSAILHRYATARKFNMHKCLHLQSMYAAITSLKLFASSTGLSKPGVLKLVKHVTQLISKYRVRGQPTAPFLHCNEVCTCTQQK